ncbi:FAD-binding protein [Streptomyces sp. CB02400]|uniref:FAD-binding protein n=1 Tax=Streptomyces sp. CB02400 TaxID=1703944 RepID=UPI00093E0F7A|nr:FAD-binding protein [Streptomyces sp. CB02400]OKK05060.1 succinate dehydrogenase [Streptomyces sp. CB02400]
MSSPGHQVATSVLVVGAGTPALRAAIEVAEAGVAVMAMVTHMDVHAGSARGDREAVLTCAGPVDRWESHAADSLREAHSLADPRTARIVARHAASVGEYTGREVRRALREHARRLAIPVLSNVYVTRLLVDDGTVFGAYGFDLIDGSRYLVHADSVILATGGHTRLWRRTASRRNENTGDSFRLAVEAGARLRDPELVRFHPFGLVKPDSAGDLLVSEATRGEGGVLLNNRGERFMTRYDAERMELSGLDTISLASYTEIKEGRGTQAGGVWLDLSLLPRETVLMRLPKVYHALLDSQMLDITRDPIEVAPTAQCSLGGVRVRTEDHGTDVDGLFVTGEAASGPHGANRSEADSLTEPLVHGRVAGRAAAEYSARLTGQRRSPAVVRAAEADVNRLLIADGDRNVRALHRSVRHLMTEHAGVVRDESGLVSGLAELDEVEARMMDMGVHVDIGGYQDLAHAYDLRSAVVAARATLECALERRETRDCHNRSDHPEVNPGPAVSLVWSPTTGVRREAVPPVPTGVDEPMGDASSVDGTSAE